MGKIQVRVMRLPHAADLPLPAYQTAHAAGLDLTAAVPKDMPIIISPGGRAAIPTGLAFALPAGVEGQIRSRSGLALHYGVTVLNSPGTLDPDYRGELHVILANFGDTSFAVARGTRIAQLVLAPFVQVDIHEVTSLDDTARGIRGSTGTADLTFDYRKRIALHEAAHAVAARAYGVPVEFAEVGANPEGSSIGRVVYTADDYAVWNDFTEGDSAWIRTVAALAGPNADIVFCGVTDGGMRGDFRLARQFAEQIDPKNSWAIVQQAWTAALKIVRDNRTIISCLAAVLERNDKLPGSEIDGIIGGISHSGKARPGPLWYREEKGMTCMGGGLKAAIATVGSIEELARRLNVSIEAVSKWDRVPIERLDQTARVTGIPRSILRPDFLIDSSERLWL